jgi:predicted phage terminase large subunit-like protein
MPHRWPIQDQIDYRDRFGGSDGPRAADFDEWLIDNFEGWQWDASHLINVRKQLERVTNGEINRLMLFLPPRHGKSEMVTVRYSAWTMERDPEKRVIIGAYNQTLANKFSRKVRKIARDRVAISRERTAVDDWETEQGGGLRAVGVGAGVTGMGGDLIIIDDPVKNREEANSPTYRDRVYDWYTDDLYTRQEPSAAIVLIMTRWHEDDLAGRILSGEDGDSWEVVKLPALAIEGDPLGRETGAALWPQRYDVDVLANFKVVLGRAFHALYQQNPQEQEGDFFKRSWFQFVGEVPAEGRRVRYWDKGASIDGDYTVGLLMCYADPYWYVEDLVRGQWTSHERNQRIRQTAEMDGPDVKVYLEQEPGSSGVDSVQEIIRMLAGYSVHADKVTGDKGVRAEPFAAQAEAGNVKVKRARWNATYIDELTSFPVGSHDDQVDGSSGAFMHLVNTPPPAGAIIKPDMSIYRSKRTSIWD